MVSHSVSQSVVVVRGLIPTRSSQFNTTSSHAKCLNFVTTQCSNVPSSHIFMTFLHSSNLRQNTHHCVQEDRHRVKSPAIRPYLELRYMCTNELAYRSNLVMCKEQSVGCEDGGSTKERAITLRFDVFHELMLLDLYIWRLHATPSLRSSRNWKDFQR
jgi:hypothetical protein